MSLPVSALAAPAFPLRRVKVYFDLAVAEDVLRQSVEQIVGTAKGERVNQPSFGCDIHSRSFEPNDPTLAGTITYDITSAIEEWEPRVTVLGVDVEQDHNLNRASYRVRLRPRNGSAKSFFVSGEVALVSSSEA